MIETRHVDGLEVIYSTPAGVSRPTPLLFAHGAFAGAWTWADHFLPWFAANGYRAYALSYRGHGGSDRHETLAWHSIADYVDDVRHIVEWLGQPPVLVGHSMGGFVVQKYLERFSAPGAVLMCSAPPQGMMAAQFHLMLGNPGSFFDINRLLESDFSNPNVIRDTLFSQPVDDETLQRFVERVQPESHHALWDISVFHQAGLTGRERPPMLVLGAEKDILVPPFLVQSTARTYGLHHRIFRGAGHALTHEQIWPNVAGAIWDWLLDQRF